MTLEHDTIDQGIGNETIGESVVVVEGDESSSAPDPDRDDGDLQVLTPDHPLLTDETANVVPPVPEPQSLRRPELLSSREFGIRVVRDPTADRERENVFREGHVDQYLAREYLAEYLAKRPEYYAEIPLILNHLLAPVFTREYVERTVLTGSIAKCMAAGMPEFFWQYPEYFKSELDKFKAWYGAELAEEKVDDDLARDTEFVIDTLEYLATGPADVDYKILPHLEYKGRFGEVIIESLGDEVEYAGERVVAQDVAGNDVDRYYYTIEKEHFNIEINYGPIPTNPDREGIEFLFRDKQTDEVAFKTHIGYMPEEAHDAWLDRRMGETSDWQDLVNAEIYSDGEWMRYSMSKEIAAVMRRGNMIPEPEEDRSIGNFAENGLRVLRDINLYTAIPRDEGVSRRVIDFNWFFPDLDGDSIFSMRRNAHKLLRDGEKIPENGLPIVFREFILNGTINPYLLGQYLRDTSYGRITPAFADRSHRFWDRVLYANSLRIAIYPGTRRRYPLADKDYARRQMVTYEERKNPEPISKLPGRFDGMTMLIDAIDEVESQEVEKMSILAELEADNELKAERPVWLRALDLFKDKAQEEKATEPLLRLDETVRPGTPVGHLPVEGKQVVFTLKDQVAPLSQEERKRLLRKAARLILESNIPAAIEWEEELSLMKQRGMGVYINDRRHKFAEVFDEDVAWEIFATLHRLSDFTAREIYREIMEEKKVDQEFLRKFEEQYPIQLLLLKLNRLLKRQSYTRKDKKGKQVWVDLYSLSPSREHTNFSSFVRDQRYKDFFSEVSGLVRPPARYTNFLARTGLGFPVQVAGTLTAEDFDIMVPRGGVRDVGDSKYCGQICRWLHEAFVQYRETVK